ncbi:MAG: nucleotidyl transferase AbiEii/AbiGii toxin family protein [Pyrinomonadaceae bacterium]
MEFALYSPEEILANKLCALLSRSEIRDLVVCEDSKRQDLTLKTLFPSHSKKIPA